MFNNKVQYDQITKLKSKANAKSDHGYQLETQRIPIEIEGYDYLINHSKMDLKV